MWGWLKTLGKGAASLAGIGGGASAADIARELAGMGGGVLSGMGKDAAANRGAEFQGQSELARLMLLREQLDAGNDRDYFNQGLQREQEGRIGRGDAWKQLMSAQRVLSPAQRPNVTPYAAPQRQATDMERGGAEALTAEVMQRLQGGNPLEAPTRRAPIPMPDIDMSLLKPGGLEKTSNWLAPILGYIGRDRNSGPQASGNGGFAYHRPRQPGDPAQWWELS